MSIDYSTLAKAPRLLLEASLKPLQGHRFQPTGFPDLGPARYKLPEGTEMLLVESAQSVANRMELACWDATAQDLIDKLRGLPYIRIVDAKGRHLSNSLLEAHRINSEYVMKQSRRAIETNGERSLAAKAFSDEFAAEIGYEKTGRVDWEKLHKGLFRYDLNSLVHGCFLEEIGGRLRVTRALSGFIEAQQVTVAESGGVKNNIVQPELKGGEGNVPFHRTEFVGKLKAYFNVDLALLRGYGLADDATKLLIAISLFKIRRFLSTGLRLRTACDLEMEGELVVTRPDKFPVPAEGALLDECSRLINAIGDADAKQSETKYKLFADPPITEVEWKQKESPTTVNLPKGSPEPRIPEQLKEQIEWKKGTAKKPPVLTFKKSLTPAIAERAKELFGGSEEVVRAIDEELRKQLSGADDDPLVSAGSGDGD